MAEYPENIEAKLIAYIEGELDAAGRVEIEEYLVANPSYRQLLEDLNRTRGFVGALPRAKAPAELVETLQGQLERSVLLDGVGSESNTLDIRTARWPQFLSIAAVVLLAMGLGIVVYLALPHGESPVELAKSQTSTRTTAPSAPTTIAAIDAPDTKDQSAQNISNGARDDIADNDAARPNIASAQARDQQDRAETLRTKALPSSPLAVKSNPPKNEPLVAGDTAERNTLADRTRLSKASAASEALVKALPIAGPDDVPPGAIHLVSRTADVVASNARIVSFLSSNGIWYRELSADLTAFGQAARDAELPSVAPGDPSVPPDAAADILPDDPRRPATTTAPTEESRQNSLPATTQRGASETIHSEKQSADALPTPPTTAPAMETRQYLARGLSPQQLSELKSVMSSAGDSVIAVEPTASLPTIHNGDEVEVEVRELVGPGVEKSNRVQVTADGKISMPMLIDPIPAAGLTAPQLADAVAKRYRDALLIDQQTVSVRKLANSSATTGPTTLPTTVPANMQVTLEPAGQPTTLPASEESAATMPTTAPLAELAPTTTPAAASMVDVVVVIHALPPSTLPATTQISDDLKKAVEDELANKESAATQPSVPDIAPLIVPITPPATLPIESPSPATTESTLP
jgi:hypothetical protein